MSKSAMGANVLYCGHAGYFIADIHDLGEYYKWRVEFQRNKSGDSTPGGLLIFSVLTVFDSTLESSIKTAKDICKQELGEEMAARYDLVNVIRL